jgi:hypothetical protein
MSVAVMAAAKATMEEVLDEGGAVVIAHGVPLPALPRCPTVVAAACAARATVGGVLEVGRNGSKGGDHVERRRAVAPRCRRTWWRRRRRSAR